MRDLKGKQFYVCIFMLFSFYIQQYKNFGTYLYRQFLKLWQVCLIKWQRKYLNKKHPRCKSQKKNNSDTKLSLSQLFHDVLKVHIF